MEIVLRTVTPEGVEVVLPALVYAKILEEHAAVADLALIDRTVRDPSERRPDPRPNESGSFGARLDCGSSPWLSSVTCLPSS